MPVYTKVCLFFVWWNFSVWKQQGLASGIADSSRMREASSLVIPVVEGEVIVLDWPENPSRACQHLMR
jgi:hypothetical protein